MRARSWDLSNCRNWSEVMERATAIVDEILAEKFAEAEESLRDSGFSAAKVAEFLEEQRREAAAWREKALASLPRELSPGGKVLH